MKSSLLLSVADFRHFPKFEPNFYFTLTKMSVDAKNKAKPNGKKNNKKKTSYQKKRLQN